jgi:hypothetical protein
MYKLRHPSILLFLMVPLISLIGCSSPNNTAPKNDGKADAITTKAVARSVVALGKIEPEGEVIGTVQSRVTVYGR